jgi:hypothetical protein
VRAALARVPDKNLPVVVQVNERAPGGSQQGLEALGPEDWPRVTARADTGEGTMETLQRAVGVVVRSMQSASGAAASPGQPAKAPRVEGNPLLGALRQLVQSTVAEQLTVFGSRIEKQLEALAERAAPKLADPPQQPQDDRLAELSARLDVGLAMIERLTTQTAAIAKRVDDLVTALAQVVADRERRKDAAADAPEGEKRASSMHALWALVEDLKRKNRF